MILVSSIFCTPPLPKVSDNCLTQIPAKQRRRSLELHENEGSGGTSKVRPPRKHPEVSTSRPSSSLSRGLNGLLFKQTSICNITVVLHRFGALPLSPSSDASSCLSLLPPKNLHNAEQAGNKFPSNQVRKPETDSCVAFRFMNSISCLISLAAPIELKPLLL